MAGITHESVALYALDALDESDCQLFESHLASCETCRADVESLTAVAAALAFAIAPVLAPPPLRARILEEAVRPPPSYAGQ
jgi:anti-sigma factor RsiW